MRKFIALLFIFSLQFSGISPGNAIGDAKSMFTWSEDGFKIEIFLENLSRPTSIPYDGAYHAVFLKGDRVRYSVFFSVDTKAAVWRDVKTYLNDHYPGEKTIELYADANLSLLVGNVEISKPSIAFNYLTNSFFPPEDSEGEFTLGANTEIILNSLTVDVEWASKDSSGDVDADSFKFWDVIQPSKTDPMYLYKFEKKIPQYLSYPILPKMSLAHGSFKLAISATSYLPVKINSLAPLTCRTEGNYVILVKSGNCKLLFRQEGNDAYEAIPDQVISFLVLPGTTKSILCENFFRMIEVSGKTAKCPTGFKRTS